MASAQVVYVKYEVQLTLTLEEVNALQAVLWSIGGSPEKSRRRYTDAISSALSRVEQDLGVQFSNDDDARDLDGGLTFLERD